MSASMFDFLRPSTPLTLAEARALRDDPPAWMRDSQKRLLEVWVQKYEKAERAKQTQRYAEVLAQVAETRDRIAQRIQDLDREVEQVSAAVKHGRLDVEEANKRLSVVFRTINEQRTLADSLKQSQARAAEMVDCGPEINQRQIRERFGVLADSIPALTLAYLDGDEDDPFTA